VNTQFGASLNAIVAALKVKFPTVSATLSLGPVKDIPRANEKVIGEYGQNPLWRTDNLKDIVRGSIVVETPFELLQVLQFVKD